MLQAGQSYDGTVKSSKGIQESEGTGTAYLDLVVISEGGDSISAPQWISEKTKERFLRNMQEIFGIDPESWKDGDFIANGCAAAVTGKALNFSVRAGKNGVEVGFINKLREGSDGTPLLSRVASIFGGSAPPHLAVDDNEVPF